jgi:hypothetical protein
MNDSYSRWKYLTAPFAENKHVQSWPIKRREIQTLHYSKRFTFFNAYSTQVFIEHMIHSVIVIINDCSRSRPCPCYEIFAAFMWTVAVTVIFEVKSAVMRILFSFFKLTIESKNIELFCNQF